MFLLFLALYFLFCFLLLIFCFKLLLKTRSKFISKALKPAWLPFLRFDADKIIPYQFLFFGFFILPLRLPLFLLAHLIPTFSILFFERFLNLPKLSFFWANLVFKILQIKITEKGKREKVSAVVSNHTGIFDSYIFMASKDALNFPVNFLVMAEVKKIPIIGFLSQKLGCIFVERTKSDSRANAKNEVLKEMKKNQTRKNQLVIFPEGNTSNGKYILPFKYGAFEPLLPLQPVRLTYKYNGLSVECCYCILDNLILIILVLATLPYSCEIELVWFPVENPKEEKDMTNEEILEAIKEMKIRLESVRKGDQSDSEVEEKEEENYIKKNLRVHLYSEHIRKIIAGKDLEFSEFGSLRAHHEITNILLNN